LGWDEKGGLGFSLPKVFLKKDLGNVLAKWGSDFFTLQRVVFRVGLGWFNYS
jgi:hypothetical protein